MIDATSINTVIFDFAGTLCSERYFVPLGPDALDAIAALVFGPGTPAWAEPWMRGDLSSADIAVHLAGHLPFGEEEILAALRQGCSQMTFNDAVYRFARHQRRAGRRTALVTANMDIFTDVVVPAHGLDALFDVVLNTADYGTLDKAVLWREAFDAFGPGHGYGTALLIEDSVDRVVHFRSLGGHAHRYRDDPTFEAWLAATGWLTGASEPVR